MRPGIPAGMVSFGTIPQVKHDEHLRRLAAQLEQQAKTAYHCTISLIKARPYSDYQYRHSDYQHPL